MAGDTTFSRVVAPAETPGSRPLAETALAP